MAGKLWQLVGGVATLFIIVQVLTPEELGFYFTFHSILGLQVLIELGFGGILMQFISHEWAHLSFSHEMEIQGDPIRRDRFIGLVRFGIIWLLAVSLLILLVGLILGGYFFSSRENPGVDWQKPWIIAVCGFVLLTFCNCFLAIPEGCQRVSEVAFIRLLGFIFYNLFGWAALIGGLKLYSIAFSFLGNVLVFLFFLFRNHLFFFKIAWGKAPKPENQVSWKEEFFPMQWRIAISCGSGYVLANFFSPVLFYFHGPVEAGRMGLTMAIIQAISAIGTAWLSTKAPLFGKLISQEKTGELKELFLKALKESYFGLLISSLLGLLVVVLIPAIFPRFENRFLSLVPTMLLFGYVFFNHFWSSQAIFLRSFKEEPFLVPTLLVSFLMVGCVIIFGKLYGGPGICGVYFFVTLLTLPISTYIWWKKWKEMPKTG